MKPWSWDKQLGLASPLKCATIQSGQTKNPSKNKVGLDVSHQTRTSLERKGKYFVLDILSHRMSAIAMFRQLRSDCLFLAATVAVNASTLTPHTKPAVLRK